MGTNTRGADGRTAERKAQRVLLACAKQYANVLRAYVDDDSCDDVSAGLLAAAEFALEEAAVYFAASRPEPTPTTKAGGK